MAVEFVRNDTKVIVANVQDNLGHTVASELGEKQRESKEKDLTSQMESLIKSISVCGQTFQIKEKESCTPPLPMLSCGTSSFKHVDDGPGPSAAGCGGGTGGRSPKLPGRKHGGGKANPYAGCGLDKFSTVLAELETRRNRILRRVGSDTGLVMVRFVQSNGAWAPVVVKLPDDEHRLRDASAARKARPPKRTTAAVEPASRPAAPSTTQPQASSDPASPSKVPPARRRRSAESSLSFSWGRMRRPACYWPAANGVVLGGPGGGARGWELAEREGQIANTLSD
uniref:Uncharacterized protein n=1 Tax=Oryza brachyantha TaxID=4533 RepID=J3LQ09_ORYBR